MSLTLAAWLVLLGMLTLLALKRPSFGIAVYMLTFFAFPGFWWWGRPIAHHRWSLIGGSIALGAVVVDLLARGRVGTGKVNAIVRRLQGIPVAVLVNATFVHLLLAEDPQVSGDVYWLLAKFVLLFFLIVWACRAPRDLRIVLLAIVLGAGYIGYEVTVNDRGRERQGRLEGVGAPGATGANQCASLMVTVLPLTGAFFLAGRRWERLAMIPVAPFILNVILLCNSRGAFLSCILSGVVLVLLAPRQLRARILKVLALGLVALYFLLGDPRIVDRFLTTFKPGEERDYSAQSRLEYWKAGLRMIADYPLGVGGKGFKVIHGPKYIREVNDEVFNARSVHNGYINEACEWGVQGLALRLFFLGGAAILLLRGARVAVAPDDREALFAKLVAMCALCGLVGFLGTCMFGDFLDAEWGYWMAAIAVAHAKLFQGKGHTARAVNPAATRLASH